MWPSTRLSSVATAASASATGSPASAARSSMAESSRATASALPARTGTPQRSANALPISDPPCCQPQPCAYKASSQALRTSAQAGSSNYLDGLGSPQIGPARALRTFRGPCREPQYQFLDDEKQVAV